MLRVLEDDAERSALVSAGSHQLDHVLMLNILHQVILGDQVTQRSRLIVSNHLDCNS